jgi:iron complex outermembrane receptor protein
LFAATGSGAFIGATAVAQDAGPDPADVDEEIIVTGSRVRQTTGMAEPTPVTVMSIAELNELNPGSTIAEQLDELPQFFATPTAQRGGNAVSTTAGGSYLNLRGMGLNRTLVLLDGTRMAPADANGSVNVDNFPAALMERVDIVTGGASAAYGADAVAGVVNFVLNREFEGIKTKYSAGITEESDGENYNFSFAGGHGFLDDKLHLIGSIDIKEIEQIGPSRDRFDESWWQDWGLVRNPAYVSATATPGVPQRITVPHVFGAQSSPQGLIITSTTGNATYPGFQYRNWTFTDDGSDIRPYQFGDYLSLGGVTTGTPVLNNQSGGPEYAYYDQATSRSSQRGSRGNDVYQQSAFVNLKYDFTERFNINFQGINGRSESVFYNQASNMTIAGALYAFPVYRENPYLPARLAAEMDRPGSGGISAATGQPLTLASIQMTPTGIIDGAGRINIYDNRGDESIGELTSYTVGFDWDLTEKWSLGFDYQQGESTVETGILNVPRIDKFFLAMDAVRDPVTQEIRCNIAVRNPSAQELYDYMHPANAPPVLLPSPLDPYGVQADSPIGPLNPQECVPFNPFGLGNANQAAKDWIVDPEKKQFRVLEQDFAEVLATGVVSEGWGAGALSLAAGLTWRDEVFTQDNYPVYGERGVLNVPSLGIRGIPAGFAGAGNRSLHPFSAIGAGNGERSVWEWFTELNMPIWEFDSGKRVGSTFAFRQSDYKLSGVQDSWKIGFDADLMTTLRWRATKSHDIREPNFSEIFLTGTGGGSVIDRFRNNEQNNALTVLTTANPALGAETGDTITTGIVWQPDFATWIEGLQLSLDWYDIDLSNAVTPYGAQRIVDDCFATGITSVCDLIQRLPPGAGQTYGPISRILNQNINADMAKTRGVDLEFIWGFEPDFLDTNETFQVRGLLGRLHENSTTTVLGARREEAGTQTRPVYSGIITGTYNLGRWGLSLQGDYYHRTLNNILFVEGVDIDDGWVASQTTFSFAASYRSEPGNSRMGWSTSFNITNLTDQEPSIVANATGQTNVMGHDALGRRYQVSFNFDF